MGFPWHPKYQDYVDAEYPAWTVYAPAFWVKTKHTHIKCLYNFSFEVTRER